MSADQQTLDEARTSAHISPRNMIWDAFDAMIRGLAMRDLGQNIFWTDESGRNETGELSGAALVRLEWKDHDVVVTDVESVGHGWYQGRLVYIINYGRHPWPVFDG
jgi:hypothetical protein